MHTSLNNESYELSESDLPDCAVFCSLYNVLSHISDQIYQVLLRNVQQMLATCIIKVPNAFLTIDCYENVSNNCPLSAMPI